MQYLPKIKKVKQASTSNQSVNDGRRNFLKWAPAPIVASLPGMVSWSPSAFSFPTGPGNTPFNPVGKGGLMVQSPYSLAGDFEVLLPSVDGHALSLRRRNSEEKNPWETAVSQSWSSPGTLSAGAQTFSSLNDTIEAVVIDDGELQAYYRDNTSIWKERAKPGINNAQGMPAVIEAYVNGSLELHVVVGLKSGGMVHLSRNEANFQWNEVQRFGSGNVQGVAMLQSEGVDGNGNFEFELAAWVGNSIQNWSYGNGSWVNGGSSIADDISGAPALILSDAGLLELLAPISGGGIGYYQRAIGATGWTQIEVFGNESYRAVGLLQAQFGRDNNNREAIGIRGDEIDVFWHFRNRWRHSTTVKPFAPEADLPGNSDTLDDTGVCGINATLMHDGRVLMFGFFGTNKDWTKKQIPATTWDPVTGETQPVMNFRNNFCAGQVSLPDGRVMMAGGHVGTTRQDLVIFDPSTHTATLVTKMNEQRWYPSLAHLPDGSIFIISGSQGTAWNNAAKVSHSWQTYHPTQGLSESVPIPTPFSPHFPAGQPLIDLYPYVCMLPNGELLVHARNTTRFFDWSNKTWSNTMYRNQSADSRTYPFAGAFNLLPLRPSDNYRARLFVSGGASNTANVPMGKKSMHDSSSPAVATAEILDLGDASPQWKSVASMNQGRLMHDSVMLPDGTLFCCGGNASGHADDGTGPTLIPELYNPEEDTWSTMPACRVARGYHTTALLLPDARVMISGKDGQWQGQGLKYGETRTEVYSPPYLFKGDRPFLSTAPAEITYEGEFIARVGGDWFAKDISQAVLVACGSTTHSTNFSQRLIELEIDRKVKRRLHLIAPPNSLIAPPGGYMLFLLTADGVPSLAKIMTLTGEDTLPFVAVSEAIPEKNTKAMSLEEIGDAPKCLTTSTLT